MKEHDAVPGRAIVKFDEWRNYQVEGWEYALPDPFLLYWLARQISIRRRPFLVLDHTGKTAQVAAIVNARVGRHGREKRLFAVYTMAEPRADGGWDLTHEASWGEILFLDPEPRTPPVERLTPRSWIIWSINKLCARRKRWQTERSPA